MEEKTFSMNNNIFVKYAYRQMPTLNILCILKNVDVPFKAISDMHFKKVYRIPGQKKIHSYRITMLEKTPKQPVCNNVHKRSWLIKVELGAG